MSTASRKIFSNCSLHPSLCRIAAHTPKDDSLLNEQSSVFNHDVV